MDHRHASVAHRTSPPLTRLSTLLPGSTEPSPVGTLEHWPWSLGHRAVLGALSLLTRGWRNEAVSSQKKGAPKPLRWEGDDPRTPGSWAKGLPLLGIPIMLIDAMRTLPRG